MRQEAYRHRAVWRLAVALTLAVFLCLISTPLASAQDLAEYFQLSYDPVTFDKSEINGSEVFHAAIAGRATCTQDLPVSVSEASLTSQVVAVHAASGTTVTLYDRYTISIKPFPSRKGETAEISQEIPLQFPALAESGDYNVIGKIVEAKVKVFLGWLPVTEFLPQEQPMGSVKYIAPESTAAPSSQSTPTSTPPEKAIAWWVWLMVAVAAATTAINIVWFLRHRTR